MRQLEHRRFRAFSRRGPAALAAWLCLAAAVPASAAHEGQLWAEAGLAYRLERRLELHFGQHLRMDDNFGRLREVMPQVDVRVRVKRWLRLGAGYRLRIDAVRADRRAAHRVHYDARFRWRLGLFRLDVRERLQQSFGNRGVVYTLRHRLRVRHTEWKVIHPAISVELFNRFGIGQTSKPDGNAFRNHKLRLTAGSGFAATDHEWDLFYRVELPLAVNDDPTYHIIGLAYHYDIDHRDYWNPEVGTSDDDETVARSALLFDVLSPVLRKLGSLGGINSATVSARYEHAFDDFWGLAVIPYVEFAQAGVSSVLVGVRAGPRMSLSGRGLEGWYLFPFGYIGWMRTSNYTNDNLLSAAVLGGGLEGGYAWHWSGFVLELGAGVSKSLFVGEATDFDSLEDVEQTGLLIVNPMLNVSVGYAW